MLITKAINNNVVLAEDENGRELVLFGKPWLSRRPFLY